MSCRVGWIGFVTLHGSCNAFSASFARSVFFHSHLLQSACDSCFDSESPQRIYQTGPLFRLGQIDDFKAEGFGDRDVAFGNAIKIKGHHMFEQKSVAIAMRQVRKTAQTVRHRMNQTEARIGKRHPRQ